jgi:hypothetical protein
VEGPTRRWVILLKRILEKQTVKARTELNWLRTGSNDELLDRVRISWAHQKGAVR